MQSLQIASNNIRICNLCNKPISTESAYTRHVAYCRRTRGKPKKRKRSCKTCHSAKAKCSFEAECSRCRSKGLHCIYEKPSSLGSVEETTARPESLQSSPGVGNENVLTGLRQRIQTHTLLSTFGSADTLHLDIAAPRRVTDIYADPVAQHNAGFLLEAIRGLPRMMTRRETLPWFIHGYCYGEPELPETITSCIKIVQQSYLDRAPHQRKDSLWPVIDTKTRRFLRDLQGCSRQELLISKQAQIIYAIVCMLDNMSSLGIPEVRLQILMSYQLYCMRCQYFDDNAMFEVDAIDDPCETWGDWVYAESHRRTALLWFLMSRVADLKFGVTCPVIRGYRTLPLPAPGPLWSARSQDEWKVLRDGYRSDVSRHSLRNFGDLIKARLQPPDSELGKQLDDWYASCDQLGILLSLATTMV